MTEKTWQSEEDMYALNTAWMFAMDYFKIPYPKEASVANTIFTQFIEIRRKAKEKREDNQKGTSMTFTTEAMENRKSKRQNFENELEMELEKERIKVTEFLKDRD